MEIDIFLGIDCGTQGTKALLMDAAGAALGRGYAPHNLIERASGAREQEPQWWVDALVAAVKQAGAGVPLAQVQCISVSGQQHGLVVLDEDHRVIRPAKLWNDTETAPENAALIAQLGGRDRALERFGILPLTGYTVSKLVWMRAHEPENFARIRHILLPHEYLNFWLTGVVAAEAGDASGTGFFDNRSRTWIREILDTVDGGSGHLFRALPPLVTAEQTVGSLRPEAAAMLALPPTCRVAAGGGDNMMGAIGTGNVREGVVTLSLGTSSTVYSYRNSAVEDRGGNIAPFCSSSGGWLPLVCTMNATNVVTQTVEMLGRTVADIEAALANTEPGAGGLVFLPFLNGERTPDLPSARGSIVGIAATNYTPDNLIRGVIEGVTFGVLNGLRLMLGGAHPERILLIGGGARSAAWRQMIADITGASIEVPQEEEAGCLGAVIQAMYALAHESGQPTSFIDLTDRLVRVDGGKSATPDREKSAAYAAAWTAYNTALEFQYPQGAAALLHPTSAH